MTDDLAYVHVYKPGAEGQESVTLLLLHGMGGDENALHELGRMLQPGVAQLRPRGNVLENGMSRFFNRLAEGVLDVADLKLRTVELTDFVQRASEIYGFASNRVIAVGFSNGANIAASILLLKPQALRAAILLHPMFPFEPETIPELRDCPVFISAGRADPLVPVEQTERLVQLLEQAGAAVQTFWHAGGHSINVEEVRAAKKWLAGLE